MNEFCVDTTLAAKKYRFLEITISPFSRILTDFVYAGGKKNQYKKMFMIERETSEVTHSFEFKLVQEHELMSKLILREIKHDCYFRYRSIW